MHKACVNPETPSSAHLHCSASTTLVLCLVESRRAGFVLKLISSTQTRACAAVFNNSPCKSSRKRASGLGLNPRNSTLNVPLGAYF